jgi:hypothetical protein
MVQKGQQRLVLHASQNLEADAALQDCNYKKPINEQAADQ